MFSLNTLALLRAARRHDPFTCCLLILHPRPHSVGLHVVHHNAGRALAHEELFGCLRVQQRQRRLPQEEEQAAVEEGGQQQQQQQEEVRRRKR
eukprot:909526-Rhodomonas_salina.1